MSVVFRARADTAPRPLVDIAQLRPDDRLALRILSRSGIAAARHLGALAYHSEHIAQRKLERLWQAGIVERASARDGAGRPAYAYRLSTLALRQLRGSAPPQLQPHLRHDLHALDVVCRLAREHEGVRPVSLWLTESMARGVPAPGVRPDALLVLQRPVGSCVLCLEIDEGTEHAQLIRRKLAAYHDPLFDRLGWRMLVVVPDRARAEWMRLVASKLARPPHWTYLITRQSIIEGGLNVAVQPLTAPSDPISIGELAASPSARLSPVPVGSEGWRELLASGGSEPTAGLLAP